MFLMRQDNKRQDNLIYITVSGLLGLIIGLIYLTFEWLVNRGTNWLWNDVLDTNTYRWRVMPLALVMSILLTIVIKVFNQKRVLKPPANLLDEIEDIKKTTIVKIITILVIGLLSLLAGASLGPEAALVAASIGLATWLSQILNVLKKPISFVFIISSLGALLAAFFHSVLPIFIPILILKKKNQLNALNLSVTIVSGLASWFTINIIKNEAYLEIPVSGSFSFTNLALASMLGLLSVLLAIALKWAIHFAFPIVKKINKELPWIISAIFFGLVLGILYYIGGQTVQFSGSEGINLLAQNPAQYGVIALVGLIIVKIFATSWSTVTGYRGGLVFPSIYSGVVLSLIVSTVFNLSGQTEAGTVIGAITGMLMAMTNPIIGIILALSMFPISQISLVVGAVIGGFIGLKLTAKLVPKE